MPTKINLDRMPFLNDALKWIREHPGCSKKDIICGLNDGRRPPNQTYAEQNSRIGILIAVGLVENKGKANHYALHEVAEHPQTGERYDNESRI